MIETLASVLAFDGFTPMALQELIEGKSSICEWADHAYPEWVMASDDGRTPGRWWILPVLYGLMPQHPPSTIRSVLIGLEAMGVVSKHPTIFRVNPKTRTKSVRLTAGRLQNPVGESALD